MFVWSGAEVRDNCGCFWNNWDRILSNRCTHTRKVPLAYRHLGIFWYDKNDSGAEKIGAAGNHFCRRGVWKRSKNPAFAYYYGTNCPCLESLQNWTRKISGQTLRTCSQLSSPRICFAIYRQKIGLFCQRNKLHLVRWRKFHYIRKIK